MIHMKHHAQQTVCEHCGKLCATVLVSEREEFPDRDQNGMSGRIHECWVSDCCRAGYDFITDEDREYDSIGEY